VGFAAFRPEELEFVDRGDGSGRTLASISEGLTHTRAKFWRYPPGTKGRRHAERKQEEVYVILEGAASMDLGDPPERVELPQGSVCAVQAGIARQLRNDGHEDVLFFILGAPPVEDEADYFPDVD
jgi:mannose-6-phosphate isomerase-like protein (cupin superfamily)